MISVKNSLKEKKIIIECDTEEEYERAVNILFDLIK